MPGNMAAAQTKGRRGEQPDVSAGSYKGGERFSRELAFWRPRLKSADAAILPDKETIEARARDLTRNNGFALGVIDTTRDRVVGHRYRLVLQPDYRRLGIEREVLRVWAKQVEGLFQSWFDDPEAYVDASRRRTGVELLRAGMVCDVVSGEAVMTREFRDDGSSPYATCFQLIEPERLSTPENKTDGPRLRAGVELGAYNDALAYHFRAEHPDDIADPMGTGRAFWARVPRLNDAGVLNVFHVFEANSPGHQTRGVSRFAPIVQKFKQMDRLEDAELEISIAAAVYGMAIESQFGPHAAMEAIGGDYFDSLGQYMTAQAEYADAAPVFFDGVRIPHLFPGEKMVMNKAEHPVSVFAEFEAAMLRHCSRAFGMSYEQLSGDYTKTNYSSARASMAEAWAYSQGKRTTSTSRLATLMFRAWLDEAVARGIVPLPPGVTNYRAARSLLSHCQWIGAGRTVIDEVKSAVANRTRIETGEATLAMICAENGLDWEEVLEQRAEEIALSDSLGVSIAGGGTASAAGILPPERNNDDTNDDESDTTEDEDQ